MSAITVRFANAADAEGIIQAHHSAVHVTGAQDYPAEILTEWSAPVSQSRVNNYVQKSMPEETTLVAIVDGKVAGFAALVEAKSELRAVYVHADFGGRGVGSALLREIEKVAQAKGCTELRLNSSLTALPFYKRHGYEDLGQGLHTLRSGRTMACVKMRKLLF